MPDYEVKITREDQMYVRVTADSVEEARAKAITEATLHEPYLWIEYQDTYVRWVREIDEEAPE